MRMWKGRAYSKFRSMPMWAAPTVTTNKKGDMGTLTRYFLFKKIDTKRRWKLPAANLTLKTGLGSDRAMLLGLLAFAAYLASDATEFAAAPGHPSTLVLHHAPPEGAVYDDDGSVPVHWSLSRQDPGMSSVPRCHATRECLRSFCCRLELYGQGLA